MPSGVLVLLWAVVEPLTIAWFSSNQFVPPLPFFFFFVAHPWLNQKKVTFLRSDFHACSMLGRHFQFPKTFHVTHPSTQKTANTLHTAPFPCSWCDIWNRIRLHFLRSPFDWICSCNCFEFCFRFTMWRMCYAWSEGHWCGRFMIVADFREVKTHEQKWSSPSFHVPPCTRAIFNSERPSGHPVSAQQTTVFSFFRHGAQTVRDV